MKNNKAKTAKLKKKLIGSNGEGLLQKLILYVFVIIVGFVFLYPLIHMVIYSFMDSQDLMNPLVSWVPSKLYLENYEKAFKILNYVKSLFTTIYVSVIPAMIQTVICSAVGYGLARYQFAGKKIVMALVIATFIIPSQVSMIPQYLMYRELGILNSLNAYILPAIFGQGMKSSIFILIFYQFFRQVPRALEEAAQIDGAGYFKIFFKVAVPTALPGFLITFLLSTVWYWNETYMATMYFGTAIKTLPMKLAAFAEAFKNLYPADSGQGLDGQNLNEAIKMAGTFLNILPLLVLFFFTQKWFVEGIDKSGITGE